MTIFNKRILLFSPAFFGYENKMVDAMIQLGAQVDYYDERSITSSIEKSLLKISPKIFYNKTSKYYKMIINSLKDEYDYIVFIKCEMPSPALIKEIKVKFTKAKLCLYLWDSLQNIKGIKEKIGLFDFVSTFDKKEAIGGIHFRPLFFSDEYYEKQVNLNSDYKYDICFIGTAHNDRHIIVNALEQQCNEKGLALFSYLFLQSKFIYIIYKIFRKQFRRTHYNDFNYKPLPSSQVRDIIRQSRVVLDIQSPRQTGLTIRTIESLGMKKKIITTNQEISGYSFYNPHNVCTIDRKKPFINEDFIVEKYQELTQETYKYYSIESWIYGILGEAYYE